MIVQNLYHANLKINAEGTVSLENAWQLARSEPAAELETLLDEVRAWAGKIGDPFRIPAADGSFEFAETLLVSGIDIKPIDLSVCRVTFSGAEFPAGEDGAPAPAALGAASETRASDGALRRKRTFRAPATLAAELIPSPGRVLDWEGGAFVCESCTVTASALAVEFEVTARETTLAALGLPVPGLDADGFETREAAWFVAAGGYEAFAALHPVGGAEAWAGEQFLLTALEAKAVGKIGYEVTLKTRKAETRRISQVRTEEFAGIARSGAILREIVWKARWRVLAADLPGFRMLTGSAPADWAEPGCLVTKVTPARLNDLEYEVDVEAQHSGNPGLFDHYSTEDRSGLDTRTDVAVDMADFHITAEMAGYSECPDGQFLPVPNWKPLFGCPFQTEAKLAESLIEKTVRCLVITVSVYVSGRVAAQIEGLADWAATRRFNGNVAGINGSYLKIAQHCKETCNDVGQIYTRITRSYQKSPTGLTWSGNYWETY